MLSLTTCGRLGWVWQFRNVYIQNVHEWLERNSKGLPSFIHAYVLSTVSYTQSYTGYSIFRMRRAVLKFGSTKMDTFEGVQRSI